MTSRDRAAMGRRSFPLLAVACVSLLMLLTACTSVKQILGMDTQGPDEFAVESRAPLTIPPDFNLRPPSPGAARPQEASAQDKARKVMDTAGPGEPGKQASFALQPGSAGPSADKLPQVAPDSFASKLLGANDSAAGASLDSRQTTPLKGVY
jgi:hypothetical protein